MVAGCATVLGLRGRDAETRALDDALDLLASGRRSIVLVEGEAGIGKTRLLDEALDQALSRGFEVARGQAEELERTRPFGVVADAFRCVPSSRDPRRSAIAALLAIHGSGGGLPITVTSDASLQFRAVDAFVELAEDLALRAPLLIGLDDLQWADPSSVLTIGALVRRLGDLPVGLVGCLRALPHGSQVQSLTVALDDVGARHLILGPLPAPAVADLVSEGVDAEPGPTLLVVERFIVGEWDDAVAEIEAGSDPADEVGVAHSLVLSYGVLSLIRLHRNDIAGAVNAADTAIRDLSATGPRHRRQWAQWAHALTLEAIGRPGEAFAALAQVWDECAAIGFVIGYRVLGPDLVRLALANGDRRRATDVALAVVRLAQQNDVSSLTGAALRCQGLAEGDPEKLIAATDAYQHSPRQLELAQTCEDAGVALARPSSQRRARKLIEQALEIYERLDATRDVLRAEAALRDLGVRRGRRGSRARPQTGWASLTPTERSVADLVAQGLSNPQVGQRLYVSRRTVQTHLGHIFAKLDIASRAQLAAEVARRH